MGEDTIEKRSQDVVKLLNYGFSNYKVNLIKKKGEVIGKTKVKNGKKDVVDLILMKDAKDLMNIDDKNDKYTYELKIDDVKAPIKKGKSIGKIYIYDNDKNLIDKVNITVKESILKANLWDLFKKNLNISLSFKTY